MYSAGRHGPCSPNGRRVADLPWVRRRPAQTHVRLKALRLLNWQMVGAVQDGTLTPQDASAVKVYGAEARRDGYAWLMEITAAPGAFREGSAGAILHGDLERGYRSAVIFTFGGGNDEIQREIISWIGLGMPRVRRWSHRPGAQPARLVVRGAVRLTPARAANRPAGTSPA